MKVMVVQAGDQRATAGIKLAISLLARNVASDRQDGDPPAIDADTSNCSVYVSSPDDQTHRHEVLTPLR